VAAFTGLGGSFPVDWVATFTGIRTLHYIFKQDLQTLADEIGVEIRIAHYPPYCSMFGDNYLVRFDDNYLGRLTDM